MIIHSISGLRFTLDELNDDLLLRYANAFHQLLPRGKIIIGRDGRPSGEVIEKTLAKIITHLDREVEIVGVVPTPTLQLYVEKHSAAGGICITASHNPAE